MSELTKQQEHFAYLVANGMTKTGAYREAYKTEKMKPTTIWKRASELSFNSQVAGRIAEIQQAIITNSPWSKERSYAEKVDFLDKVKGTIEHDGRVSQGAATAFISVVSELDDMLDSDLKRKQKADADIAEMKAKQAKSEADYVEKNGVSVTELVAKALNIND